MFIYLLSEGFWVFLVCYLPAPLQIRRPPEFPARLDLPSAVLGCPRVSCAPQGRVCPHGSQGTGAGPQPVGAPGVPDQGHWEPCGGRASRVPCRAVFFNSPTASHPGPPPPRETPSRSTKIATQEQFQKGAQDSRRLCPRSRCHTPMITGFIPLKTGIPLL